METKWLPEGVTVASETPKGVVLQGPPAVLARLCTRVGFKDACSSGRVYVTADKVRWLKTQVVR